MSLDPAGRQEPATAIDHPDIGEAVEQRREDLGPSGQPTRSRWLAIDWADSSSSASVQTTSTPATLGTLEQRPRLCREIRWAGTSSRRPARARRQTSWRVVVIPRPPDRYETTWDRRVRAADQPCSPRSGRGAQPPARDRAGCTGRWCSGPRGPTWRTEGRGGRSQATHRLVEHCLDGTAHEHRRPRRRGCEAHCGAVVGDGRPQKNGASSHHAGKGVTTGSP